MQHCHTLDALVALYQSRDRIAQCLEVERALRCRGAGSIDVPCLGLAVVVVEDSMPPRLHGVRPRVEPADELPSEQSLLLATSGESFPLSSLSDERSLADFADDVLGRMVAEFIVAGHRMGSDPAAATTGLVKAEPLDSLEPADRTQQPELEPLPLFSMGEVVDGVQRRHRAYRCLEQARRYTALSEPARVLPMDGADQAYSELLHRWEYLEEVIQDRKGHQLEAELRPYNPQFDASLVQRLLASGGSGDQGDLQPVKQEGLMGAPMKEEQLADAEAFISCEGRQPSPYRDPDLDPAPASAAFISCEDQQPDPHLDLYLDLDPAAEAIRRCEGQRPGPDAAIRVPGRSVAPDLIERESAPQPRPRLGSDLRPQRQREPSVTGPAASKLGAGARVAVPPAELRGLSASRHKPAPSQPRDSALLMRPPSTFLDARSQAYIAKKRAFREEMAANSALVLPVVRGTPVLPGGGATAVPPAGRVRLAPFLARPEPQLPARRTSSALLPATMMQQQHQLTRPAAWRQHVGGGCGEDDVGGGAEEGACGGPSGDCGLMMMTEEQAEAWAGIKLPPNQLELPQGEAPRKRARTAELQPGHAIPTGKGDADGRLQPPGALPRKVRFKDLQPGHAPSRYEDPWLLQPPSAPQKGRGSKPWLLPSLGAPREGSDEESDSDDGAPPPLHTAARSPVQPPRDPQEPRFEETRREQGRQREEPRERPAFGRRVSPPPREATRQQRAPNRTSLPEWRLTDKLHGVLAELPLEAAMVVYDTALGMVLRQQCRKLQRESFSVDEVRQMIPMTTLLRNRHGGIARYYLLRRGRFDHFCFDPSHRLLWPSGGKGAPGGPQGDVGDCGDAPEAWIVCEWDEELWLDLVALLYQLLGQAGGRPVSLSKLRTKMPQKTAEYISSAGGLRHFIMENFHQLVRHKFLNGCDAIVSKHNVTGSNSVHQMGGPPGAPPVDAGPTRRELNEQHDDGGYHDTQDEGDEKGCDEDMQGEGDEGEYYEEGGGGACDEGGNDEGGSYDDDDNEGWGCNDYDADEAGDDALREDPSGAGGNSDGYEGPPAAAWDIGFHDERLSRTMVKLLREQLPTARSHITLSKLGFKIPHSARPYIKAAGNLKAFLKLNYSSLVRLVRDPVGLDAIRLV